MKKIYLASPFFNEVEIERMEKVRDILRAKGLQVFVPMECQNEHLLFGSLDWRKATFKSDMEAIYDCDVMVAIVDSNMMDSGTAFEMGACHELKKPLVVVNIEGKTINLMIAESLHALVESYEELENYDFETMPVKPYLDYVW